MHPAWERCRDECNVAPGVTNGSWTSYFSPTISNSFGCSMAPTPRSTQKWLQQCKLSSQKQAQCTGTQTPLHVFVSGIHTAWLSGLYYNIYFVSVHKDKDTFETVLFIPLHEARRTSWTVSTHAFEKADKDCCLVYINCLLGCSSWPQVLLPKQKMVNKSTFSSSSYTSPSVFYYRFSNRLSWILIEPSLFIC